VYLLNMNKASYRDLRQSLIEEGQYPPDRDDR